MLSKIDKSKRRFTYLIPLLEYSQKMPKKIRKYKTAHKHAQFKLASPPTKCHARIFSIEYHTTCSANLIVLRHPKSSKVAVSHVTITTAQLAVSSGELSRAFLYPVLSEKEWLCCVHFFYIIFLITRL